LRNKFKSLKNPRLSEIIQVSGGLFYDPLAVRKIFDEPDKKFRNLNVRSYQAVAALFKNKYVVVNNARNMPMPRIPFRHLQAILSARQQKAPC